MKKVKIGQIGVDAGLCWVGDPCYIIGEKPNRKFTWEEFCNEVHTGEYPTMKSFNYEAGHEGLGICVSAGFGDGYYDVYATIEDIPGWGKRIKKVEVIFIEDNE